MVLSRLLAAFSCALLSAAASATAYSCVGKVDRVSAGPGGDVSASFTFETGSMHWQDVCRLHEDFEGIAPVACKGVLAMLTTARMSGQRVEVWFDNQTPGQCNATPWQRLKSLGWYWGPSVLQ